MENTVTISVKEYDNLRQVKKNHDALLEKEKIAIDLYCDDTRYMGEDEVFKHMIQIIKYLQRDIESRTETTDKLQSDWYRKNNTIKDLEKQIRKIKNKWWYKLFNGKDK